MSTAAARALAPVQVQNPRTFPIAGVDFDLISADECLTHVLAWSAQGMPGSISLVNPHSVLLCRRDKEMRQAIASSTLNLPDGVGIVLGARLLRLPQAGRTCGPELMLHMCDQGRQHKLRHYFYGGQPGVAQELAQRLTALYPGLEVVGVDTPPFRALTPQEDRDAVARINNARADIVWVGLGAPKQEKWIAAHRDRIHAPAMIGVGAAFDFHSGNIPWCPAPIRKLGLEWAYRLSKEPRRMWRRNLDSFLFLGLIAAQMARRSRSDA